VYHRSAVPRLPNEIVEANIRRYAHAKGMSLDAVARASGISTVRLLAIFRGDFDPDLDLIGEIATVLGVTLSELLAEPDYN
jgi:transcriptional regulator with XRE-family HTH domain